MTESTLTQCYIELMSAVGYHLYGKRELEDLTSHERAVADECVTRGYRQFLYPPGDEKAGVPVGWEWSFLHIVTTITTADGDADQDMPDTFGRLIGDGFTYAADAQRPPVLADVGEGKIRKLRLESDESGRPRVAAFRRKSTDGQTHQLFEVMWYPEPDDSYVLSYRFAAEVDALTNIEHHAYGGLKHADTLTKSCIERADAIASDIKRGGSYDEFMRALAGSIKRDRAEQAKFYGNVGTKDEYDDDAGARDPNYTMTIGGTQYYPSS